jgi:hypothetical protein
MMGYPREIPQERFDSPTPTESEIRYLAGYLAKIPLRSWEIGNKRRWVVFWFIIINIIIIRERRVAHIERPAALAALG